MEKLIFATNPFFANSDLSRTAIAFGKETRKKTADVIACRKIFRKIGRFSHFPQKPKKVLKALKIFDLTSRYLVVEIICHEGGTRSVLHQGISHGMTTERHAVTFFMRPVLTPVDHSWNFF